MTTVIDKMNPNSKSYLTFSGLTHSYGDIAALEDLSGSVPSNSICGFIGPDGAGKSTLLSLIVGLSKPDGGKIEFAASDGLAAGKIGYMPQQFSLYQDLTVSENLLLFAKLYRIDKKTRQQRYEQLLEFSRLKDFTDRRAENLSGGMKQKLALICVLMYTPPLLVLDEPTTGVDPMARNELWEMLHQLKKDGHTILVSTPYMEEAVQCDQVYFMTAGKILAHDSPDNLQQNYSQRLFEIRTSQSLTLLGHLETQEWIRTVYPMGDRLHLSVDDESLDIQTLETMISDIVGQKLPLSRIEPGMEDVYASLEVEQ